MRLGIIGLAGSGKSTLFTALTRAGDEGFGRSDRIGTVKVPDRRIDILSRAYQPRKTIYAQVEYFLPAASEQNNQGQDRQPAWNKVRDCDALIHVIRNFTGLDGKAPEPEADFNALDQELILADLMVVEKRLERLELDRKRGKKPGAEEVSLLEQCRNHLEAEQPLRRYPELCGQKLLRGYALLSAKPMLVVFNNQDEDEALPRSAAAIMEKEACMVVRAKLEQELAQMSEDDARDFLAEFNISASAVDRVIARSYQLLGLISFFTVGQDEVRAWTIRRGTPAVEAAGAIHSDMQKGFIRAEVLAFEHWQKAGGYPAARKEGLVRLEGKTYPVRDGDIITFRFNV